MYINPKLTAREKLALRGLCKQMHDQTESFCESLSALNESMNEFNTTILGLGMTMNEVGENIKKQMQIYTQSQAPEEVFK